MATSDDEKYMRLALAEAEAAANAEAAPAEEAPAAETAAEA